MHHVGIVDFAANLIGEVCREVEVLVAAGQIESTRHLRLGATDDGHIVGGDVAVAVQVLELSHAGECGLSLGQVVGLAAGIACSLVVGDAFFQCPYTVYHIEVVDSVDTVALESLNQTDRLVDLYQVVIIRYAHG